VKTLLILTASALLTNTAYGAVVDFDELNAVDRPVYGPASPDFVSKGTTFNGGFYAGWSYSNDNDTTTPGFTNQYAAYTGTDVSGSGNYGIANGMTVFDLPAGQTPVSVRLTNATYAALSMLQGDGFAKQFGGPSGDDADYFDVTFTGHSTAGAGGSVTGSATFRLADYTSANSALDYIVDSWELLDLTPLGAAASVSLSWDSTDLGSYGINTPLYVAIDNLTLVPEPASVFTLLAAGGLLGMRRRRVG
jgi:Domain of unknown function (DUF4465)